jgi:hypothetical protein
MLWHQSLLIGIGLDMRGTLLDQLIPPESLPDFDSLHLTCLRFAVEVDVGCYYERDF